MGIYRREKGRRIEERMADIPSSTLTLQEGVGDGQSIALFLRTHVPAQCKRTVQGDRGGRGPGLGSELGKINDL